MNSGSVKISGIKKEYYVAKVHKLTKSFVLIVTCWFVWFSLAWLKMLTVVNERSPEHKKGFLLS